MAGLYATRVSKARVIVKNNRTSYSALLNEMGLESIVSPTQIACNIILRAVRTRLAGERAGVERIYRVMGGQAEAIARRAKADVAAKAMPSLRRPPCKRPSSPNLVSLAKRNGLPWN